MNAAAVGRLRCPTCKSVLRLIALDRAGVGPEQSARSGEARTDSSDVRTGLLLCSQCTVWYPIYSYVPVLLTYGTSLHRIFASRYQNQIQACGEYREPYRQPQVGERWVQRSFTEQWAQVQESKLSFLYTEEDLKALNTDVWLTWLKTSHGPIRSILNVGCGLGKESIALQEVIPGSEVFAIDLNFGVLESAARHRSRPGLHFVIASLFNLPFETRTFDLVYSQGVIHHTFSTRKALEELSTQVVYGGYMFIWVYGLDDHLVRRGFAGLLTRLVYGFECVVRPVVSKLPKAARKMLFYFLSALLHPLVKARVRNAKDWSIENTNHDLRDWLSPRYAHRHSYNELMEWFEDLEFQIIALQSPATYRKLFNRRLWGVGLTGRLAVSTPDPRKVG
jgi:SAM-dependent methyltransferase/uncharacterized protein YbaR (Trm112 family)